VGFFVDLLVFCFLIFIVAVVCNSFNYVVLKKENHIIKQDKKCDFPQMYEELRRCSDRVFIHAS
jgi:hypothetical protein